MMIKTVSIFKISLISSLLVSGCAYQSQHKDESLACGVVSVFFIPPPTKDLYPATISRINDDNVIERPTYRLKPGQYTLKIYEQIHDERLRVSGSNRGRSKKLTVNVEENQRYDIVAQFHPEQRFRGVSQKYWDPIVWRTEEKKCRL